MYKRKLPNTHLAQCFFIYLFFFPYQADCAWFLLIRMLFSSIFFKSHKNVDGKAPCSRKIVSRTLGELTTSNISQLCSNYITIVTFHFHVGNIHPLIIPTWQWRLWPFAFNYCFLPTCKSIIWDQLVFKLLHFSLMTQKH